MIRTTILWLLIWAYCAHPTLAQTTSLEDSKKQLEQVRSEAEKVLNSQGDLFKQLEVLDRELELSSRVLRQIRQQSQELEMQIDATDDTLRMLRESSASEKPVLIKRIHNLYTSRDLNDVFVPFAEANAVDREMRQQMSQRVMQADNERLTFLSSNISAKEQLLANLETSQGELKKLIATRSIEERRATDALIQREKVLASLKGQSRELSLKIEKIEESASTIGDIFTEIESDALSASDYVWNRERQFSLGMKGKFFWPVSGEVQTGFGTKVDRSTGLSSKSNGIVIKAKPGTKIVAALTGEVIYIGWARGLERFVVVDHGGSIYSLYGRLGELYIQEGSEVVRGEPFATAAGSGVHFEIRDGKTPVNPLDWLRK